MKTIKAFPLLGLISSVLLILAYLFLLIKFLPGFVNAAPTISIHLYTQLILVFILLALRDIIVKTNGETRFSLVFMLLLITQSLIFITSAVLIYKLAEIKLALFFPAIALIVLVLFMWLVIMILLRGKRKYAGQNWLKGFAVAFIFFFLVRIAFLVTTSFDLGESVTMEDIQAYNTLLRIVEKLPYIFLIPFFFKYMRNNLPVTGN